MKESELKLHPCYCGGEMEIKKVAKNGGMDGTYWDWKLTCSKCGLTKYYAADGFYGRKYKTFEEVVDDWNKEKHGDCISRQAVLDIFADNADATRPYSTAWEKIRDLSPVNPQPKIWYCKDCKYFEYDSVAKVDGIPLIVAHEICSKWGNGCKTKEDGYCFLFEPQESEE